VKKHKNYNLKYDLTINYSNLLHLKNLPWLPDQIPSPWLPKNTSNSKKKAPSNTNILMVKWWWSLRDRGNHRQP